MKKLLLILVIAITVFLIYLFNIDNKVYYLSIDSNIIDSEENSNYIESVENYLLSNKKLEKTVSTFSKNNYLVNDLISDIKNNKKITVNNKNITLKNALIKADLLTLSIGMNEINNKLITSNSLIQYTYIDNLLIDIDNLLSLIREYCKEDIFIIGVYYPDTKYQKDLIELYSYYNEEYKKLAEKYNIKYIDLYNVFLENQEYLSQTNNFMPSLKGYKYISDQIIITIGETVLKNSWFYKKNLLYYMSIKFL